MRMHPLVTVKKAASLLGVEKTAIREKLLSGEMKGEVRRVGDKDKWFVYSGELDFLLESQRIPELEARAERVSLEGLNSFFEKPDVSTDAPSSPSHVETNDKANIADPRSLPARIERAEFGKLVLPFEQIMEVISRQFSIRLEEEHAKSQELKQLLNEQQNLIASIPSLEMRLESQVRINEELKDGINSLRVELEKMKTPSRKGWWSRFLG